MADFEVNEIGSLCTMKLERDFYRELSNQHLRIIDKLERELIEEKFKRK